MTSNVLDKNVSGPAIPADIQQRKLETQPVPVRTRAGRAGKLVVACVLDTFSSTSFGPETDLAPLTMGNWLIELTAAQPDLLLVESAWRGHQGTWWNTVHQHGPELRGILNWCRERGVPAAFWNKEDPVHFNTFLTTASLFDFVFTTDLDCVPRYKSELEHDRVYFLPFAAQMSATNPAEEFSRIDSSCAFAGAYYDRYPDRNASLREFVDTFAENGLRFDIYDRNLGKDMPGYMFPPEYEELIVGGGLGPEDMNVPYKAYSSNLNLNSVKQSQSMFARRAFELIASNTLVLSNYSRGLRILLGDLTISTDSGGELQRRLQCLAAEPRGEERLRAMALRKILSEHTYRDRLDFVASACGVVLPTATSESVALIAAPQSAQATEALIKTVQSQTHGDIVCILIDPALDLPGGKRFVAADSLENARMIVDHLDVNFIGVLDPADYYGPNYVLDLVFHHRWADVPAVGHADFFSDENDTDLAPRRCGEGAGYSMQEDLDLSRSLVRTDRMNEWGINLDTLNDLHCRGIGFSLGNSEYWHRGRFRTTTELKSVSDLNIDTGASLAELRSFADDLVERRNDRTDIPAFDLCPLISSRSAEERIDIHADPAGILTITSSLPAGTHRYVNFAAEVGPAELFRGSTPTIYLDTSPGLDLLIVLYYLDDSRQRISHEFLKPRTNNHPQLPEHCSRIRLGFRISGSGQTDLRGLRLHEVETPKHPVFVRSSSVVLTNIYPSYDNLYRNGFIHSRTRAYLDEGERIEVLRLGQYPDTTFAEFEDIDTAWIGTDVLEKTLDKGSIERVLVHFLDRSMWSALKDRSDLSQILIWVHGAEVQPWWRREYNYRTEAELEAAKSTSKVRLAFWREVFLNLPSNFHFVFVSEYLAEEVFEDLGLRLPGDQYSVIHNPIDTAIFAFESKPNEQSARILTIRPYASAKYANDLSVAAILELSQRPGFEHLKFRIIGDGPLFDETLEPLRGMSNVQIDQGFLNHAEIASIHKDFGVFLTPTRWDSQGVSRDEAMASGLVPVTSSVAAIPEFLDSSCGFLAGPEDHKGLAEAIWALAHNEELFQRMSNSAAERVRAQTAADVIIPLEMKLIFG